MPDMDVRTLFLAAKARFREDPDDPQVRADYDAASAALNQMRTAGEPVPEPTQED